MTPAIELARKSGIDFNVHKYTHEPDHPSYGTEAAEKLGIPATQVFKTLLVMLDRTQPAIAIIPVSQNLNMKQLAKAASVKKAEMADKLQIERQTGYIMGGVSPLGQKKLLTTYIDSTAMNLSTIFVSAGRRGLEIELSPTDLARLTRGNFADLCKLA